MDPSAAVPNRVRFGLFEADIASRELRKHGRRVPLQDQPFQVLALLLGHPGELVTREELQQALWPTDTFVEFEHGVNTAIKKIRQALGDSADNPRFIETLPRRGYRFIAPVEQRGEPGQREQPPQPVPQIHRSRRRVVLLAVLAGLTLIMGGLISYRVFRQTADAPIAELRIVPLTTYPGDEEDPSFSPDGNQVAFSWDGEDQKNTDIYVKLLGAGQLLRLTTDPAPDTNPAWSPDGQHIAFCRAGAIYSVTALGGPERKLADLAVTGRHHLSWSPDGKFLAFRDKESPAEPSHIFLLSMETLEKRKLPISLPRFIDPGYPEFSPDGRGLAFIGMKAWGSCDIYIALAAGGVPRQITFDGRGIAGLAWTPDSREIIFSRGEEYHLWRIAASGGTPRRLPGLAGFGWCWNPAVSRQGRRLVFVQGAQDSNIWRLDLHGLDRGSSAAKKFIASTWADENPQYSPDGKRIVFISDRSGTLELWLCRSDGSNPVQLTSLGGPQNGFPAWSPDGSQIAFDSNLRGNWDIYVIKSEGGAPRALTTDVSSETRPSWSQDGRWIYFCSDRTGSLQIWKMPAGGGAPVQVTRSGGFSPAVSPDGKFVYYSKGPGLKGIWRVPAEGGEETPVLNDYDGSEGRWAVADHGIYFADWKQSKGFLQFFDFRKRQTADVLTLSKPMPQGALSLSPDHRWLLYSQIDQVNEDLMLVENFR